MSIHVIEICGGLGNQMFQYALSVTLKKALPKSKVYINAPVNYESHYGYELEKVFNIGTIRHHRHLEICMEKKFLSKILIEQNNEGENLCYRPIKTECKKPICHHLGYWQSQSYFGDNMAEIRRVFAFNQALITEECRQMERLIAQTPLSVSLHVRRGDYVSNESANRVHGNICTISYYQRAIAHMKQLHGNNCHFFLFSDDLDWAEQNLAIENLTVVNCNRDQNSWQDMFLMSRCNHHIIANSSFSWWGAWLNPSSDKSVVVPDRWFNLGIKTDIVPSNWIQIETQP